MSTYWYRWFCFIIHGRIFLLKGNWWLDIKSSKSTKVAEVISNFSFPFPLKTQHYAAEGSLTEKMCTWVGGKKKSRPTGPFFFPWRVNTAFFPPYATWDEYYIQSRLWASGIIISFFLKFYMGFMETQIYAIYQYICYFSPNKMFRIGAKT